MVNVERVDGFVAIYRHTRHPNSNCGFKSPVLMLTMDELPGLIQRLLEVEDDAKGTTDMEGDTPAMPEP